MAALFRQGLTPLLNAIELIESKRNRRNISSFFAFLMEFSETN